jgi:hypothetical protein
MSHEPSVISTSLLYAGSKLQLNGSSGTRTIEQLQERGGGGRSWNISD